MRKSALRRRRRDGIHRLRKTEEGDDIAVEIASRPANEGRKITGRVAVPIDVFQRFKLSDGKAIAAGRAMVDVKFDGVGRSPGGVLAMLNGSL